jgi:hypothetical protein
MRPLRSLTAVVAGFGFMTTAVLIGTNLVGVLLHAAGYPNLMVGAGLLVAGLAAVMGGWIAGRIAVVAPLQHAMALAALLALLTTMMMGGELPPGTPGWYPGVVGGVGVAGVLLGGWLRSAAAHAQRP